MPEINTDYLIRLVQRWVGAPETGDLNDEATVKELIKDLPGLQAHTMDTIYKDSEASGGASDDPKYQTIMHSTPNKSGGFDPKGILIHHSGGSFSGTLSWIKQRVSSVSYHLLIALDGTRHQVVPYNYKAWHAGKSFFKGRKGCNSFLIGLSVSGDTNKRDLTKDELDSIKEVYVELANKYRFGIDDVTYHAEVSPGRKNDVSAKAYGQIMACLRKAKTWENQ